MKKVFILILTLLLLGCCSCAKASDIPDFQVPEKKITPAVTPKSTPHATQTPHSEYNEWVESAQLDIYHGSYVDGFDKKSLQELESASCIIVLATVVNKKQVDATPPDEKEYGLIHETTATTLKIEKIFKNTTDEPIEEELLIEEIYHISNQQDGSSILFTSGYYYPAKEFGTYLFFLKELDSLAAKYTPTSRWYGKYPVTSAAVTAKENNALTCGVLELASMNPNNSVPREIKNIFEQICHKYFTDEALLNHLKAE